MAPKLITVERAEKEINRLQKYIELVGNYDGSWGQVICPKKCCE